MLVSRYLTGCSLEYYWRLCGVFNQLEMKNLETKQNMPSLTLMYLIKLRYEIKNLKFLNSINENIFLI